MGNLRFLRPGKLTTAETFRVGCMGQLGERGMSGAVAAVGEVLAQLGIEPVGVAVG